MKKSSKQKPSIPKPNAFVNAGPRTVMQGMKNPVNKPNFRGSKRGG